MGDDIAGEGLVVIGRVLNDRTRKKLRKIAGPHRGRGHTVELLDLIAQLEAFVIGHEEEAVFAVEQLGDLDWAAEGEAVLVPLERRGNRYLGGEAVRAGVQVVVTEKLKHGAMVGVSSTLGRDVDLGGFTPELGGVNSGLHL